MTSTNQPQPETPQYRKIRIDARAGQIDAWDTYEIHQPSTDGQTVAVTTHNGDRDAIIDKDTINGIVRVTVNGRDIEDGIDPLNIIAAILSEKLGIPDNSDVLEWVANPPWLGGWPGENDDPVTDEEVREQYGLTPLVVALARLIPFGGEDHTVDVGLTLP